MLGEGENLCAKEGEYMIRDDRHGFILEIRVVDAQVGVKPVDLVGNELSGNEALHSCQ